MIRTSSCQFDARHLACVGPTSMRSPLSRPERDERGTSQTSTRRHPPGRGAMNGSAAAPTHTGGGVMRHVRPPDATWGLLPIPTSGRSDRPALVVPGNLDRIPRLGQEPSGAGRATGRRPAGRPARRAEPSHPTPRASRQRNCPRANTPERATATAELLSACQSSARGGLRLARAGRGDRRGFAVTASMLFGTVGRRVGQFRGRRRTGGSKRPAPRMMR
jgi:hypothetical protein